MLHVTRTCAPQIRRRIIQSKKDTHSRVCSWRKVQMYTSFLCNSTGLFSRAVGTLGDESLRGIYYRIHFFYVGGGGGVKVWLMGRGRGAFWLLFETARSSWMAVVDSILLFHCEERWPRTLKFRASWKALVMFDSGSSRWIFEIEREGLLMRKSGEVDHQHKGKLLSRYRQGRRSPWKALSVERRVECIFLLALLICFDHFIFS